MSRRMRALAQRIGQRLQARQQWRHVLRRFLGESFALQRFGQQTGAGRDLVFGREGRKIDKTGLGGRCFSNFWCVRRIVFWRIIFRRIVCSRFVCRFVVCGSVVCRSRVSGVCQRAT